jgi:hypothetical protein
MIVKRNFQSCFGSKNGVLQTGANCGVAPAPSIPSLLNFLRNLRTMKAKAEGVGVKISPQPSSPSHVKTNALAGQPRDRGAEVNTLQEASCRTFLEWAFLKFTSAKKSKSALENVFIKSGN